MVGVNEILQQFNSVETLPDIGSTPARVARKKRALQLNAAIFPPLPEAHKVFILLHELGHCELDTSNEFEVDKWASNQYIKLGYSLTESVRALTTLLNGAHPDHTGRAGAQLERAAEYDYRQGNKNAYKAGFKHPNNPHYQSMYTGENKSCSCGCGGTCTDFAKRMSGTAYNLDSRPYTLLDTLAIPGGTYAEFDNYDPLDYEGRCYPGEKPRKCRIRLKAEGKYLIRSARSEKIRDKGESLLMKQNAATLLAAQGIQKTGGVEAATKIIGSVGDAAAGALGAWKGTTPRPDTGFGGEPKKDNTMLIVLGVAGAAVVGLILFFVLGKK